MELLRAVVLGIVQGITEFIPVSSDGHLVVVRQLLGWPDEGLAFDAALHLGTFLAVLVYFRATWLTVIRGRDPQLFRALVLGTVPAALVGILGERVIAEEFRGMLVIVMSFLVTAALLFLADRWKRVGASQAFTLRRGFLIGCAQIFALLPGLSRSGVTMAAGVFTGLTRERAVEFSFLLSLPITLGAGLYGGFSVAGDALSLPLAAGALTAFLSGLAAIHGFLYLLRATRTFTPYVLYLVVVSTFLVVRSWL